MSIGKLLLILLSCLLIFGATLWGLSKIGDAELHPKRVSATDVLRDYLAGKPVSENDFYGAFESAAGGLNVPKVRRVAEDVGMKTEDLLNLLRTNNRSVVFSGAQSDVPAKFRVSDESGYTSEPMYSQVYTYDYTYESATTATSAQAAQQK